MVSIPIKGVSETEHVMSKGPPPPIKPKPKNLPPIVGKKPNLNNQPQASSKSDDVFIASLKGNLRKTNAAVATTGPDATHKGAKQSVIDSVISKPIDMSLNPDAFDSADEDEEDEHETPGISPVPTTPARNALASPFKKSVANSFPLPPQRNQTAIAATMAASPLKKSYGPTSTDTASRIEGSESIAFAEGIRSPLKKSSMSSSTDMASRVESPGSIDFAEGMRSPLKKNSFPPPPRRISQPARKVQNPSDHNETDDLLKAPKLPARKPLVKKQPGEHTESDGETPPPKLPPRKHEKPQLKPKTSARSSSLDNSEEYEYSDEYAEERSIHVNSLSNKKPDHKNYPDRYSNAEDVDYNGYDRHGKHRTREISGSYRKNSANAGYSSSDDEYGYGNAGNRRIVRQPSSSSSSSQFLNSAKTFSKDSYYTAKEKSAPLAKQAMGGLNKMKDKIKGSKISQRSTYDSDDDNEEDDDDRYRSMARGRDERNREDRYDRGYDHGRHHGHDHLAAERHSRRSRSSDVVAEQTEPARHARSLRVASETAGGCGDQDASELRQEAELYDTSIDEDRPVLPLRKVHTRSVGIPLPGLTDDVPKSSQKIKPDIPAKVKPQVSSKPKPALIPEKSKTLAVPAPPSRRSNSVSSSASSVPPPAPPSRGKAPVIPPSRNSGAASVAAWKEPTLDLQLESLWFMKDEDMVLPKDLQNLNYQCSHGFVGSKAFKVYAFRLSDLSTLRLKFVWNKDSPNPARTITNEVEFIPPPSATVKLLKDGTAKYGEHIASWCEMKEGQTVGNGECWTLAHDALQKACGKHAFVSTGLVHGALIATYIGSGIQGKIPKIVVPAITDEIRRGDVLQFTACEFKYTHRTLSFGAPDHTAVVVDVKPGDESDADGRLKWLEIIHQNMGGVKKVRVSEIDLGKMVSGELRAYRPVDAEWITDLGDVVI